MAQYKYVPFGSFKAFRTTRGKFDAVEITLESTFTLREEAREFVDIEV